MTPPWCHPTVLYIPVLPMSCGRYRRTGAYLDRHAESAGHAIQIIAPTGRGIAPVWLLYRRTSQNPSFGIWPRVPRVSEVEEVVITLPNILSTREMDVRPAIRHRPIERP
jgi:hypothetical protein